MLLGIRERNMYVVDIIAAAAVKKSRKTSEENKALTTDQLSLVTDRERNIEHPVGRITGLIWSPETRTC